MTSTWESVDGGDLEPIRIQRMVWLEWLVRVEWDFWSIRGVGAQRSERVLRMVGLEWPVRTSGRRWD